MRESTDWPSFYDCGLAGMWKRLTGRKSKLLFRLDDFIDAQMFGLSERFLKKNQEIK